MSRVLRISCILFWILVLGFFAGYGAGSWIDNHSQTQRPEATVVPVEVAIHWQLREVIISVEQLRCVSPLAICWRQEDSAKVAWCCDTGGEE